MDLPQVQPSPRARCCKEPWTLPPVQKRVQDWTQRTCARLRTSTNAMIKCGLAVGQDGEPGARNRAESSTSIVVKSTRKA
eukprot:1153297-Pelagomonas_calceolata.AAC.5